MLFATAQSRQRSCPAPSPARKQQALCSRGCGQHPAPLPARSPGTHGVSQAKTQQTFLPGVQAQTTRGAARPRKRDHICKWLCSEGSWMVRDLPWSALQGWGCQGRSAVTDQQRACSAGSLSSAPRSCLSGSGSRDPSRRPRFTPGLTFPGKGKRGHSQSLTLRSASLAQAGLIQLRPQGWSTAGAATPCQGAGPGESRGWPGLRTEGGSTGGSHWSCRAAISQLPSVNWKCT